MKKSTESELGPAEAQLLRGLKAGEGAAAETLVRTHAGRMLAVATRIVGERALAEDCVQEAFIKAFANIGDFEERSRLASWLRRIVVNQALMKLRSKRSRNEASIDELLPAFDEDGCRVEPSWDSLATPEELLQSEGRRSLVRAKIDELPESYRTIVYLRDVEDCTIRELAEALDLSEANVKVRLHRGRAAFKKLIEPLLRGEL